MLVMDLVDLLNAGIDYKFYPNSFPENGDINSAVVQLTGGTLGASVSYPTFQVIVRAAHPAEAEKRAWDVFLFFNNKTNYDVGETHVVLSNAEQSTPLFIGDENGRYFYSINFRAVI